MKAEDRKALKEYQEKLKRAQCTGNLIDPDESLTVRMNRIQRAKRDVRYLVETYLPHYATADCADFQIAHANRVMNDPIYKGYAEWGRGLAKSVWNDVIIPLWLWINGETHYMCIVSDTFDRACDLLEDLRAEFEANELLKHDFGEQYNPGYWEKGNFVTMNGFICKAFGAKQKVRGLRKGARRPDLWIIDDLETPQTIKNNRMQDDYADWIEADVLATMTGKRRRLIGANNRFASRMVQTILKQRHPDWDWHLVKAYDPVTYEPAWKSMYSPQFYRQQEKDMGILAAHAEYNHVPLVKGKIFKPEMVKWGKLPDLHTMNAIVAHWDIAYAGTDTSDFNACKIWGRHKNDFWLIDGFVKQSKMKLCVQWMCMKQAEFRAKGIICFWQYESQFWNDEVKRIIGEAETETGVELNLVPVQTPKTTNKILRMISMHPYYQNSRMHVNEELKASPDITVGLKQLYAVEPGMTEHDDSPDADEQAVRKLEIYTDPPQSEDEPATRPWKAGRYKRKYTW
ncbi:psiM2_ORF9: phage uncharacterized protein, C-terminal domain [Bacteroides finegoldii]|uniref:Terminase large subunit gp17-like C-terminal domain-containing protein n=1 Tax=Bacteroides finegoldii CL09T03C10 TaxID=997888 RepID=K5DAD2_9BACE|nr:hypothetical protein [Bacteroides finegoldii]EKJ89913.1 hypothetical protein HMPREF1057_03454 [Bacteroides finegoldii CL09T03C10]